jgi:ubiquitin C-terminal hydrolase
MLQVKDLKGVNESLKQLFEFDRLEGSNRLECEYCGEKTDTLKG